MRNDTEDIAFLLGCLMALAGEEHELALGALRSLTNGQRPGGLVRKGAMFGTRPDRVLVERLSR
jgi:hypothetical protein